MQTLPLSHALAEFLLQLVMLFHGGAEKLMIPVQLLGRKKSVSGQQSCVSCSCICPSTFSICSWTCRIL